MMIEQVGMKINIIFEQGDYNGEKSYSEYKASDKSR